MKRTSSPGRQRRLGSEPLLRLDRRQHRNQARAKGMVLLCALAGGMDIAAGWLIFQ